VPIIGHLIDDPEEGIALSLPGLKMRSAAACCVWASHFVSIAPPGAWASPLKSQSVGNGGQAHLHFGEMKFVERKSDGIGLALLELMWAHDDGLQRQHLRKVFEQLHVRHDKAIAGPKLDLLGMTFKLGRDLPSADRVVPTTPGPSRAVPARPISVGNGSGSGPGFRALEYKPQNVPSM
jgi:hypothetical protein